VCNVGFVSIWKGQLQFRPVEIAGCSSSDARVRALSHHSCPGFAIREIAQTCSPLFRTDDFGKSACSKDRQGHAACRGARWAQISDVDWVAVYLICLFFL